MGENNVKEIKCSSVEDFIQRISYGGDLYKLIDSRYIYRGESSDKNDLIPSALRPENHEYLVDLCIPVDTRSPFPVIPVHSVGNLQYMWQS